MNQTQKSELLFNEQDYVVYPPHGVGKIDSIEKLEIAGQRIEFYVVYFAKEKMSVKIPCARAAASGLRALSDLDTVENALAVLQTKARMKRGVWAKRSQDLENRIASGDLVVLAEVVRDLYPNNSENSQSYSEQQLYNTALNRFCTEVAAVRGELFEDILRQVAN